MIDSEIYRPRIKSRSEWRDIHGVRYHFRVWGGDDDDLLFALHGWGDCAASFQFIVDEFSQGRRVIAPDWRGFGDSHRISSTDNNYRDTHNYWFPDYLADLDAMLDLYSPSAPVDIVGHSMGANIAGLYAGVFPERVRKFINIEGFGLADSDPADAPDQYRQWIESGKNMPEYKTYADFDELAKRIQSRGPYLSADKALFLAHHWGQESSDGPVELRADPAHKRPGATLYRRAEALACWARVQADVLLISGEHTQFKAGSASWLDADAETQPFAGAPRVVVADASHFVHAEAPGDVAAHIESFLAD